MSAFSEKQRFSPIQSFRPFLAQSRILVDDEMTVTTDPAHCNDL
jgi:hypothetical protein